MLEPTLPMDEEMRLVTLQGLNILDTPDEERFDRLTRIAQRVFDVPIALVSLLDRNRQWFKSRQGLGAMETPRRISFCSHAIHSDEAFVIPDATRDARFADNPLVTGPPHIRFYAGQPLKANNGSRVGTLCVIDTKPRQLSQVDLDLLRDLAALIEIELNLRDTLETRDVILRDSGEIMSATINTAMDAALHINAEGTMSSWNNQAEKIFGWPRKEALGRKLHETIIPPQHREAHSRGMKYFLTQEALGERPVQHKRIEICAMHRDGHEFPMEMSITPIKIAGDYEFSVFLRDLTNSKRAELELRQIRDLLLGSINALDEAFVLYDPQDRLVLCNDKYREVYGEVAHLMIPGAQFKDIIRAGAELGRYTAAIGRVDEWVIERMTTHLAANTTVIQKHSNGQTLRISEHRLPDGHTVGTRVDITKIMQAQDEILHLNASLEERVGQLYLQQNELLKSANLLRESEALLAAIINTALDGVVQIDQAGIIALWNDQAEKIFGWSRSDAIGLDLHETIIPSQHREAYSLNRQHFPAAGAALVLNRRFEICALHRDGHEFPVEISITQVKVAGKDEFCVFLRDITERKQAEQKLFRSAHYDGLTNLPNRVLLADRLHQAMLQSQRRGKALALAYLDLDGFKQINDKYGHSVGDEMLVLLSQHIKKTLREGDTLARIGGDEFVVVLVDLEDLADCKLVLARLLKSASQSVAVGDMLLNVSASVGVALYPQDGADVDLLLRHADQAMYIAKDSGKNRYHFFDAASASVLRMQRESLQHIAQAMKQHEFVLYYQPKVNIKTGAVVGAEALIRWQHPTRGLLAPAAFMPIVEGHLLSAELGEWVISTAIGQVGVWYGQGMDLPVSVNISAYQLLQPDFAARLGELLAAYPDLKPHCLQLEVLETSALQDMVQVGAVMQACKEIGVGFALDDFGTGYSSLTYLQRLPAESLKIDQSFVREILTNPRDRAIVQGIIGLASEFSRNVIAEGVETRAHGELLLELGCELAQGYGIAWPMPANDMLAWVQKWHTTPVWTA